MPNKTNALPNKNAAFRPLVSEYLPARNINTPCTSAPIVKPRPAIAAVEFNFSVTNKGKIEDLNPNNIQLFIKASINATWYGRNLNASPKVVCPI